MDKAPFTLNATHSHLYPGARATAEGPLRDGPVIVAFADGNRVPGRIRDNILVLEAHRTAAGAAIAEKSWRIETDRSRPGGSVAFRVAARL